MSALDRHPDLVAATPLRSVSLAMNARLRRVMLALFLALAGVATVQRGVLTHGHATFPIFRQSYEHLAQGSDLYARYPLEQGTEERDRFKYSPTAALFFAPFTALPFIVGLLLWTLINVLAVYAAKKSAAVGLYLNRLRSSVPCSKG